MCSVLRHSLKMSIPTLPCPRMPMETESPCICDAWRGHQCLCLCERGNCDASLFVRFFTSLLMSTQIKMTIQCEGSEAQSPPPLHLFHFTRKENAMRAKNHVRTVAWVCVCMCTRAGISTCSESEVVFGMRGDNLEVETSTLTDFPTMLSHHHKLQSGNLASN